VQTLQYAREICVRHQAVRGLQGEYRREGCARSSTWEENRVARKRLQWKIERTSGKIIRKPIEIKDQDLKEQLPRTFEDEEHIRQARQEDCNPADGEGK
jgi:hypothetical protein